MNDYTENQEPQPFTIETLESLTAKLNNALGASNRFEAMWRTAQNKVDQAGDYLTNLVEEHADELDTEILDALKDIGKALGVKLTKTVELSVTITGTVTIEAPLGFDVSELSDSDFDVSLSQSYRYSSDDWSVDDYSLSVDEIDEA